MNEVVISKTINRENVLILILKYLCDILVSMLFISAIHIHAYEKKTKM